MKARSTDTPGPEVPPPAPAQGSGGHWPACLSESNTSQPEPTDAGGSLAAKCRRPIRLWMLQATHQWGGGIPAPRALCRSLPSAQGPPEDSSPARVPFSSSGQESSVSRAPPSPGTLTWSQPGGHAASTQGSGAGGFSSAEQGPAVAGSPVPSAPSIHVVFCTAGSAPQADEHASASLRMGHDSRQALPLPSGGRGKPAPGAERR